MFPGSIDSARRATSACVNHFAFLIAEQLFQDRPGVFFGEQWLKHHEFIRVRRALYNDLAQAPRGADAHHIWETALGIDGEHHAGTCLVRAHHFLHAGRQRNFEMIEPFLLAITDCAIGEKRRVTFAAGINDRIFTGDIEIGFLLSRKTRFWQILRRSAAPHRHVDCAFLVALAQVPICLANLLF